MRFLLIKSMFLVAILVSACDFWPRELKPLADLISQQVSGQATASIVGRSVLVITVSRSPLYDIDQAELEAKATTIAGQAVAFIETPIESIAITFYETGVPIDSEKTREFIFLVVENRPVLQPDLDVDATGPLTLDEIRGFIDRLDESVAEDQGKCVLEKAEERAVEAGDPETLDPHTVEFLPPEAWNSLDAFGKRLILMGAITTGALFDCTQAENG